MISYRPLEECSDLKHIDQLSPHFVEPRFFDPVDAPVQLKALEQRQIPPQMTALTKHHSDISSIVDAFHMGRATEHADRARRRHEHAGQHLDHGRLASTIRAEITDCLSRLNSKGNAIDRLHIFCDGRKKITERAGDTRLRHLLCKPFGRVLGLDDRWHVYDSDIRNSTNTRISMLVRRRPAMECSAACVNEPR